MRILVVGGAGYIGSICSEVLLDEGHEVAIFDNLTEGHRGAVEAAREVFEQMETEITREAIQGEML